MRGKGITLTLTLTLPTVKGVLPSLTTEEDRPKVSRRRRPELVSVDALTSSAGCGPVCAGSPVA